jgi:hypothetical protein
VFNPKRREGGGGGESKRERERREGENRQRETYRGGSERAQPEGGAARTRSKLEGSGPPSSRHPGPQGTAGPWEAPPVPSTAPEAQLGSIWGLGPLGHSLSWAPSAGERAGVLCAGTPIAVTKGQSFIPFRPQPLLWTMGTHLVFCLPVLPTAHTPGEGCPAPVFWLKPEVADRPSATYKANKRILRPTLHSYRKDGQTHRPQCDASSRHQTGKNQKGLSVPNAGSGTDNRCSCPAGEGASAIRGMQHRTQTAAVTTFSTVFIYHMPPPKYIF